MWLLYQIPNTTDAIVCTVIKYLWCMYYIMHSGLWSLLHHRMLSELAVCDQYLSSVNLWLRSNFPSSHNCLDQTDRLCNVAQHWDSQSTSCVGLYVRRIIKLLFSLAFPVTYPAVWTVCPQHSVAFEQVLPHQAWQLLSPLSLFLPRLSLLLRGHAWPSLSFTNPRTAPYDWKRRGTSQSINN